MQIGARGLESPATEVLGSQYLKQIVELADGRRVVPRTDVYSHLCPRLHMSQEQCKGFLKALELLGICRNQKRGIFLLTEARQ